MIESIQKAQFHKIRSNHCTGLIAVTKMTERNLPVVKGRASYGIRSGLYVGNGGEIVFSSVDPGGVG
jgi:hypothetical protein